MIKESTAVENGQTAVNQDINARRDHKSMVKI
jgi:hypothetical protein